MADLLSQPKDEEVPLATAQTVEFELKFTTDAAGLRRIPQLACLSGNPVSRARHLVTVYYDTAQGTLLQNGISLRLRKVGRGRGVMTFKAPALQSTSSFLRREIEIPAGPNGFDLAGFDVEIQNLIKKVTRNAPLIERYATDFRRKTIEVNTGRSTIEIALDSGTFLAGDKTRPLHEVEIELKSGDSADAIGWAKNIALEGKLRLETVSKAERCALLAGLPIPTHHGKRAEISRGTPLDKAIAMILSDCLQHYLDYIHPFRNEQSPHSVHQMRVGLRRLRAALKMFSKSFPEAGFRLFADQARVLATGLGDARDCDAFRQLAFGEALAHTNRPSDAEVMQNGLEQLRIESYAKAAALIESEQNLTFILDLEAFILQRAWRANGTDAHFAGLAQHTENYARDTLDLLMLRARKRGKDLLQRSDEERHEFRISLKNLRYNAALFGPLFGSGKTRKSWMSDLADLQEILGLQNDLANAAIMIDRIKPYAARDFSRSAGFVIGWHACNSNSADRRLEKVWKQFRAHKVFWN
jgi:inorganic triphosphatase YgiF